MVKDGLKKIWAGTVKKIVFPGGAGLTTNLGKYPQKYGEIPPKYGKIPPSPNPKYGKTPPTQNLGKKCQKRRPQNHARNDRGEILSIFHTGRHGIRQILENPIFGSIWGIKL